MKSFSTAILGLILAYTPESAVKFFSNMTENKLVLIVLAPITAILMTYSVAIYTLIFFIFVDLYTGIKKDLFTKNTDLSLIRPKTWINWKSITSSGFRKSWTKVREYALGILLIHLIEKNILGVTIINISEDKSFSLTLVFIMILAGTEVWSIFENLEVISGRNKLKNLLSFLPDKMKEIFRK
jgi:hypothetical protein